MCGVAYVRCRLLGDADHGQLNDALLGGIIQ